MAVVDALVPVTDKEQVVRPRRDQGAQQPQGLRTKILGFINHNGGVRMMPLFVDELRRIPVGIVHLFQAPARQLGAVISNTGQMIIALRLGSALRSVPQGRAER